MQTVAKNWSIEGVKYRKDTKHATVWHCFTLLPYLPSLFLLKYQPSLLLYQVFHSLDVSPLNCRRFMTIRNFVALTSVKQRFEIAL